MTSLTYHHLIYMFGMQEGFWDDPEAARGILSQVTRLKVRCGAGMHGEDSEGSKSGTDTDTGTHKQAIVARAEGWEGRMGDLETALLLLGATEEGGAGEDEDGAAAAAGEEAAEILQEAGKVARELADDLERWQVRKGA